MYGAAVSGMSDVAARTLSREIVGTLRPKARGRNVAATLALAGIDVLAEATLAPMGQWAKEVWRATLPAR